MENKHMPMPQVSPATMQGPFPTSVMPAHMNMPMNAPMQVSPAMYEHAHLHYMHKGAVLAEETCCRPSSNVTVILVLFILLVIILRGRW